MTNNFLVLQTDFGLADGAVAAMYGVAYTVDPKLTIANLTHEIPAYDIFAASYRLLQTIKYWPPQTVFVSVVDPGVGSARKSVVAKTKTGHYIVTPDNGTLTHVANHIGLESVKEIDEIKNRLPHSEESHTFHGRDVYVYNGAKLAQDETYYNDLKNEIAISEITSFELGELRLVDHKIYGTIDILDIRFGSLWTNIPSSMLKEAGIQNGDTISVTIYHNGIKHYQNHILFGHSFADVAVGEPVGYINSLLNLGVAINQQNFSETYGVGTGIDWNIEINKI
ncbi:S-adenosyl-l-methionine hydroxide adenosyltransferase family protein [Aerococcus sp. HMSC10H05]|uniref:SAM hydrolase/SAM-dependent halogenase family protein n=1 Tax=Aerococcus sp. HMSC10H05 TaxID=1581084 RepID=UPI0008A42EC2|nr:S-adenosyl-l-methionine hydroxide adenosyltransferase family protein [Aerococcus sp. HMSC10H05]OFU53396.1 DNA-directed RNA polymerase subunit delta [Aerococcus sp. HMSC10H05]